MKERWKEKEKEKEKEKGRRYVEGTEERGLLPQSIFLSTGFAYRNRGTSTTALSIYRERKIEMKQKRKGKRKEKQKKRKGKEKKGREYEVDILKVPEVLEALRDLAETVFKDHDLLKAKTITHILR